MLSPHLLLLTSLTHLLPLTTGTSWIHPRELALPRLHPENRTIALIEDQSGVGWTPGVPCPRAIEIYRWNDYDRCLGRSDPWHCRFDDLNDAHLALKYCSGVEELGVYVKGRGRLARFQAEGVGDYVREVVGSYRGGTLRQYVEKAWRVWWGVEQRALPLRRNGKDRYPALRRLRLDGYVFGGPLVEAGEEPREEVVQFMKEEDFDGEEWEKHVRSLRLGREKEQGERLALAESTKTNLELWLQAMDWSKLEELSINWEENPEADVLRELPKRLTGLKALEITSVAFIQGLRNNSLTHLKWVGPTRHGELATILAHQGHSLQSLEYRCEELDCPTFPSHFNIPSLTTLAPNLQHLSINLPRSNAHWPWDTLANLSRLPHLHTLTLYFRMQSACNAREALLAQTPGTARLLYAAGPLPASDWRPALPRTPCSGPSRYQNPYLNHTAAASMFSFLRRHKRGAELTDVTFLAGDFNPEFLHEHWEEHMAERRARVTCGVVDRAEVCRAENQRYWLDRYGVEMQYLEEDGGYWYGDAWRGAEEYGY